ncbi:MAG: hypothetical protein D6770_05955 [Anaerolineae bacterium]|nr:MAG: hypothetical protein D6770_05955 [Anaerolineae bacterium]
MTTENGNSSWKVKTLALGAVIGALTGLGAAYLLVRRAEQKGEPLAITSSQGLRLGMLVVGLLRQIARFGEE